MSLALSIGSRFMARSFLALRKKPDLFGNSVHGIAQLVERRTHDRKVASLNLGRSGERIFFSRVKNKLCVLILIRCPFQPRVTTVARERPWSFCQKCRWLVISKHAYTLDPAKSECSILALSVELVCVN